MNATWKKIDAASAPFWLEIREGKYKTSYRIRFRQDGLALEQKLKGDFDKWQDAEKVGERLIYEAKFGTKPKDVKATRTEDTCDEMIALKRPLSIATYNQAEIFSRVHMKPYLRGECAYEAEERMPCAYRSYIEACPYTSLLTPSHWLGYKAHLRLHKPTVSLFNHWKYFGMLFKYAFERGLLERPIKLAFDQKKEDSEKRGIIMPDADFQKFIAAASRTWRDRAILQRLTGQRPGVIRGLRKNQVDLETGLTKIEKADSKNRRQYDFIMPRPVLEILRARLEIKNVMDSPYFFPMETDHSRPMHKNLNGWDGARSRAGINDEYTPHDLRHTFLTMKFKSCPNPALICYQCDLSLDEAMKTYVHFTAEDTRATAEQTTIETVGLLAVMAP